MSKINLQAETTNSGEKEEQRESCVVAYVATVEVFFDNGFMCNLDRSVGL